MFDFVDKVVYINLEYRTDRKQQIESELGKYFPSEKIQRFNAIKHQHGGIGCTQSHIAILEMAIQNNWNNVLIVEDDATWSNFDKGYPILENLIKNNYDVIMLGGVVQKLDLRTYKLYSGHTGTSYIVNKSYYSKLLQNLKESLSGFLMTMNYHMFALDQYWKRLQPVDNWFCIVPSLMIQRPGMSDIEHRFVNNGQYFI